MISLHRAPTPTPLWREIALPWLERAAREAWRDGLPWVVVTPHRVITADFKRRWANSAAGAVAVRFLTLGQLRRLMAEKLPELSCTSRQTLSLLLRAVASRHDSEFARAISRNPALVLDSLIALAGAGENPASLSEIAPEGRAVLDDFFETLRKFGQRLPGQSESAAIVAGNPGTKIFSRMLFWGLDASHWGDYLLLRLSTLLCSETTICALSGLIEECWAEALWQSTWESFGALWEDHTEDPTPGFGQTAAESVPQVRLVMSRDDASQAAELVACTLRILQGDPEAHVLIGLPGRGTLHSEVVSALRSLDAQFYDGVGRLELSQESEAARRWIALQREWTVGRLLDLVRMCPWWVKAHGYESVRALESELLRAVGDILDEDLDRVSNWLRKVGGGQSRWARLPSEASLAECVEASKRELGLLGLSVSISELTAALEVFGSGSDLTVSREAFLDWLEAFFHPAEERGTENSRQFFARITLCRIEHLAWCGGRHILMAGLNEGVWPPPARALWFDPLEVRAINSGNTRQSPSGAGERCVTDGQALLLDGVLSERIALRLATLAVLNSRRDVHLFCSRGNVLTGRPMMPSLLLAALENQGLKLEPADFRTHAASVELQTKTFAPAPVVTSVEETRLARSCRLEVDMGSGEFDFRAERLPTRLEPVSVTSWASALRQPPAFWLAEILRVEPVCFVEDVLNEQALIGRLAHEVLTIVGSEFIRRESLASFTKRTRQNFDTLVSIYQEGMGVASPKALPVPLQFVLARTLTVSLQIAQHMDNNDWPPQICCEWKAPVIEIAPGLHVTGRLDAVLRDSTGKILWVVDYKTGQSRQSVESEKVQLSLYAKMVFHKQGITPSACVVSPEGRRTRLVPDNRQTMPHTDEEDVLLRMWSEARFPLRESIRDRFAHSARLPLATLQVPTEILQQRWENWLSDRETGANRKVSIDRQG